MIETMDATRIIKAGRLIDGSGSEVQRESFIAIKEGIISAIGQTSDLPENSAVPIDDFSHCIILPALIDCSVSLGKSPSIEKRDDQELSYSQQQTLLNRNIKDYHSHGVLSVMENEEIETLLEDTKKENQADFSIDIQTAKNILKINYSSSIDEVNESDPTLSYSDLINIIAEKGDRKVVVIANSQEQVTEAIDAGCDAIEQGYLLSRNNLEAMAEKGILWIPSLSRAQNGLNSSATGGDVCCRFSLRYAAPGKPTPGAEEFWLEMLATHLEKLQLAVKLGVKIAAGTGAGSRGILHGESVLDEIKLFIKAGFSLEKAIEAASTNGADFCKTGGFSSISVGKPATFLITRGSVKQLPRKLSYLEGIYINGSPSKSYRKNPIKVVR